MGLGSNKCVELNSGCPQAPHSPHQPQLPTPAAALLVSGWGSSIRGPSGGASWGSACPARKGFGSASRWQCSAGNGLLGWSQPGSGPGHSFPPRLQLPLRGGILIAGFLKTALWYD